MNYKKMLAMAAALTVASVSCADKNKTSDYMDDNPDQYITVELIPPSPAEASDPNAVTFDDDDFSFVTAMVDDIDSAHGELSIAVVQDNKMLRFTDSGTNCADGTVQKIKIDAAMLLSPENLAKVRSVEMDVYADASADDYVNEDGENVRAPGWIGGGAGANVSGDKWYEFGDWKGGEYNFEMSGPVHITLKFLLAAGGRHWDETMTEATLQIMRWGAQNEGNFYLDNILFLDEDGNSLPIEKRDPEADQDEQSSEPTTETVSDDEEIIYSEAVTYGS